MYNERGDLLHYILTRKNVVRFGSWGLTREAAFYDV